MSDAKTKHPSGLTTTILPREQDQSRLAQLSVGQLFVFADDHTTDGKEVRVVVATGGSRIMTRYLSHHVEPRGRITPSDRSRPLMEADNIRVRPLQLVGIQVREL